LKEHIIKEFKDIDRLKKPDPENAGLMNNVFNIMKIWKKEVGEKIPLGHTDIQGPISICIDLMGVKKFFLGIIDYPKRIHGLLEIVTEYIIDSLKISYKIIGEREDGYFVMGLFIPIGNGKVRISEDNIVFLSPEICRDFLSPYIKRIFYEFDGGSLHWCGNGFRNINEILKIKGIMGINNCSMGNINIIKKQNEISIKNNIIYHNEAILPHPDWFERVNESVEKKYLINSFIVPSDKFGISFNGYKVIGENKIDCINKLIKINNNDNN